MNARRTFLVFALLVPAAIEAQSTRVVQPGDRVRVTWITPGANPVPTWPYKVVGTFDSAARDSVFIRDANHRSLGVPVAGIRKLETSVGGRRGASVGTGIMLGLLGGALLGAALGYSEPGDLEPGISVGLGGALFAVPGMLIGGIIGAATRERWASAQLPDARP